MSNKPLSYYIYLGIQHFRFMLERRVFTVYTDHKPFVHAMLKVTEPWSARQRHLSFISKFNIQHSTKSWQWLCCR